MTHIPTTAPMPAEYTWPNDAAFKPGPLVFTPIPMTRREEYAKAAMQGLLAGGYIELCDYEVAAEMAVEHADALIVALLRPAKSADRETK